MSENKKKVAIVGSGNWFVTNSFAYNLVFQIIFEFCFKYLWRGSSIAKIIGTNVSKFAYFDREVKMYVYEEIIDGRKLSEIINTQHENVKYLPGHKIPENVVCFKRNYNFFADNSSIDIKIHNIIRSQLPTLWALAKMQIFLYLWSRTHSLHLFVNHWKDSLNQMQLEYL
jgi:hypothetical protein